MKKTTIVDEAGFKGAFEQIPLKLKEYYDSLQTEAIPDRFLDLLESLEAAEQEQASRLRAGEK